MRIPTLGNDFLALIGGAILLMIGLTRSRRESGKIDIVYVCAGVILLVVGISGLF